MFAECVLEYHKKQKEKLTIGLNTDKIVKNEQLKIYIQFLENYLKPNNNPEALPPSYFIDIEILAKIHKKYDNVLWSKMNYNDFISLFDLNSNIKKNSKP